ncbi:cytochrome c-type biogenesis protein [Methylobacterium nonmethylotrophicum]|uniref:Cytochrome c-type biogenesis protein n=1 Tax=Methylobacterium nonmethylotrophicum TaxID=1141884 RepID=A0A4Z0NLS8_9HYPH|nr:cytochrome c-type biogenesis protein [Methylobacterium nonmethylotrophicum]TGD97224.1 cytochrome c-type biogenesis protein CcmH [Methylobacterium nonmethylotrophicum]
MRALRSALLALALLMPAAAGAVQPEEVMKDPGLESRARSISAGLRCLVCQNQSIDDSDAPLARDLRLIVRERLRQGDSDGAVVDYVVQRYGEFVLLRPVLAWHTAFLWLTPALVVGLGGLALFVAARRRKPAPPRALSAAEEAAVADLMRRAGPR